MQTMGQLGPDAMASVNMGDLISRVGTSLGIDMSGLVKSPEEMQAEAAEQQAQMEQQQMMEMAKAATPNAVNAIANAVQQ